MKDLITEIKLLNLELEWFVLNKTDGQVCLGEEYAGLFYDDTADYVLGKRFYDDELAFAVNSYIAARHALSNGAAYAWTNNGVRIEELKDVLDACCNDAGKPFNQICDAVLKALQVQ